MNESGHLRIGSGGSRAHRTRSALSKQTNEQSSLRRNEEQLVATTTLLSAQKIELTWTGFTMRYWRRWRRKSLGSVEDPPYDCPEYGEGYYATFFFDPDGLKYELVINPNYFRKKALRSERMAESAPRP